MPKLPDPESSWRPLYRAEKKVVLSCFEAALLRRRTAPRADRDVLDEQVNRIEVSGFRPGKAPAAKLADRLAAVCFHHNDVLIRVVPIVLRLWVESKEDLRAKVEQSLRSGGHAIDPVTLSDCGFRKDWAAESFQETIGTISSDNAAEPSDAVELMVCCLTGRAPTDSKESSQDVEAAGSEINFDEWLAALRSRPETDPLWDAYESFIRTAESVYLTKRSLVAAGPAFTDLHMSAGMMQEVFGFSDCEAWSPSDFAPTVLEQVVADIRAMLLQLQVFHRPLSPSYKEQIEQLEQRKTSGSDIHGIYTRLSALRNLETADVTTTQTDVPESLDASTSPAATAPLPKDIAVTHEDAPPTEPNHDGGPVALETTVNQSPEPNETPNDICLPSDTQHEELQSIEPVLIEAACADAPHLDSAPAPIPVTHSPDEIAPQESPVSPSPVSETGGVSTTGASFTTMESHLWRLVSESRNGLAGALADALAQSQPLVRHTLPGWLAEVVGLSRFVASETSDIARRIEAAFANFDDAQLLDGMPAEQATAVGLLLVAASVRPALIAPRTGASLLLHAALKHVPPELYEICTAVADFGDRLQPLEPAILREVKSEAAWSENVVAIQTRASHWLEKAAQAKISYAPASRVLWKWLERGQPIQTLLQPVRQDDQSKLDAVRACITRLSDVREAKKLVDDTDRKILGRRLGNPITAGALAQLQAHLEDASAIASPTFANLIV